MAINTIKKQLKKLIENTITNQILETESFALSHQKKDIENTINDYIKNLKLTNYDYKEIKNKITEELLIKKYSTQEKELNYIIKIFSKNFIYDKIEYNLNDKEPYLYFHLKNNTSYLINYDSIEEKWYLALVETTSSNLIKEIYNNTYHNFIDFLKKP